MGFLGYLKEKAKETCNDLKRGAAKIATATCELCDQALQWGQEQCHKIEEKIKHWKESLPPKKTKSKDPVPPEVQVTYGPIIEEARTKIKEKVSNITDYCESSTPEERKNLINDIANDAIKILGIKTQPDIMIKLPEDEAEIWRSFGSYSFSENRLKLNLAMIVTDDPNLFQEQISTVYHELIHARQFMAVEALCQEKPVDEYGYSEDYVKLLARNFQNYTDPKENFEAYTKQPVEAEAYWVEQQLGLTQLNINKHEED